MNYGDVFLVDLPRPAGQPGREQIGARPAIVIHDDSLRKNLSTLFIVPLTSNGNAIRFQGSFEILPTPKNGLSTSSIALTHQLRAIDQSRLQRKLGEIETQHIDRLREELKLMLRIG